MSVSAIQPLPQQVVHLIAAGEVIDSTAAAVRELAENAIDAGATRLTVTVDMHRWLIQVVDNGCGLSKADLQQAATANSTSKIRRAGDLQRICSLGFRGEALHSLAQLAALEICSYQPGADQGWRQQYDNRGQPTLLEPGAIAPGTVVTVRHLFQRLPARRQALPTASQQLRQIQTTIFSLALCHPQLTWQVNQGHRPWFKLYPGSPAQVLGQMLRLPVTDLVEYRWPAASASPLSDTLPVSSDTSGESHLVLALPDRRHRHRPDWVSIAVNGRMVQCPPLEQAVLGAFHRTLPRGRYPICLAHLRLAPTLVDWNRHPAKSEIHLQQMDDWRQHIRAAIATALRQGMVQATDSPMERTAPLLWVGEAGGSYDTQPETGADVQSADLSTEPAAPPLLPLTVLAQVHNTYILTEHPNGLWLIEQHIAHERVLYEQLCDRWQTVPLAKPLLMPGLTATQMERLQHIGVDVEPFGNGVWAVRTVPQPLAERHDCKAALQELSLIDAEAAIVATAC
ncbi:MAG: DNA mismatch repair endonuclease MutL, partial [Cyanobacteria bacterium P01_A01_bin.135]